MNIDKVIARVRKLFALGANNNSEAEAQAALMAAQKLMVEYSLSQDTVDIAERASDSVVEEGITEGIRRLDFWMTKLAVVIGENFRCKVFINLSNRERKYEAARASYERSINFIGMSGDVAIAKFVYLAALTYAEQYCAYFLFKKKMEKNDTLTKQEAKHYGSDWRLGFVSGLQKQFKEQVDKNNWALVLVTPEAVVKHFEAKTLKKGSKTSIGLWNDSDAHQAGFKTGKEFASQYEQRRDNGLPKRLGEKK